VVDHPPVFIDPLAKMILGPEGRARLDSDPWWGNRGVARSRLRAFLAVRSRVAEDRLTVAVDAGVRQYVVLGAGLDTFACRNPHPNLRVFEVDHPRTQAWKLERVRAGGLTPGSGTEFVPVDFELQSVAEELGRHGFDPASPTAVSWLGVVPYLEEHTVWTTLEWVAGIVGRGGHVAFDYGSKPHWWQFGRRAALRWLAARVAAAGEPLRTTLRPSEVRRRLLALGFSSVEDMDAGTLNRRYFAGRSDGLRVGGGAHLVIASGIGRSASSAAE